MKLKFGKDGKFRMLMLGDLHEHVDYATNARSKDSRKLLVAALDEYKPDICVLLGDICSTGRVKEDREEYRTMLEYVCKPATDRSIPCYCIMGNHEHDHDCDKEILEVISELQNIEMRNDHPEDGMYADYSEFVYSSDGEKPLVNLWFLDSNNLYEDQEKSKYDNVHKEQIEWFEKKSEEIKEMNGGKPMPSFIFQHIPVPEEYELFRKARFWEIPVSTKGFNSHEKTRYVLKKGCTGYLGEGPCAPDVNSGQFDAWKRVGGVKGAFFGHDHLNDFAGTYDGIFMAQHKTAGLRVYTDGGRSAVRLVTLDEKNPGEFTDELKHYKEFGLKIESLGPIMRTLSDRQSIGLHIISYILMGLAGAGAVTALILKLLGKF